MAWRFPFRAYSGNGLAAAGGASNRWHFVNAAPSSRTAAPQEFDVLTNGYDHI